MSLPGLPSGDEPLIDLEQFKTGAKTISVDVSSTEVKLGEEVYYLDNINAGIVVKLIYGKDVIDVITPGFKTIREYRLWYRPVEIRPPMLMARIDEIAYAQPMKPSEAYKIILDWVDRTIEHPLKITKKLIALYAMYTWFYRFFPKRTFLTVTGFFSTGKSVVGAIMKVFGRYTVQTEPGLRTMDWELAILMGTMLIDEAENLTRSQLVKLRRMHDEGYYVSKMVGAPGGWTILTLHLSSPVVLIGTHLPEDPALISRSIIIRMHYGEPLEKPPATNSVLAREFRATMVMTVAKHWEDFIKALTQAQSMKTRVKLNKREQDVWLPLCATSLLVGENLCQDLAWMVKYSSFIAMTLTPGRRLVTSIAEQILKKGERSGPFVKIPEPEFNDLLHSYIKMYNLKDKDARYVTQYFLSACYTRREGDVNMLYFYEDDLRLVLSYELDFLEIWNRYYEPKDKS